MDNVRKCVFYVICPYLVITLSLLVYKHAHFGNMTLYGSRYNTDGVPIPSVHRMFRINRVDDIHTNNIDDNHSQKQKALRQFASRQIQLSFHNNVSASEFIAREPQTTLFDVQLNQSVYDRTLNYEIYYESFVLMEPNFASDEDRKQFFALSANAEHLGVQPKEKLKGVIQVIPNGIANMDIDCGWPSKLEEFFSTDTEATEDILIPVLVPDSASFQHFLDGAMPKIVQSYSIITAPNVKLLIFRPRDNIIYEMLAKLNISTNKLVYYTDTIGATIQINSCITPPLHPLLWRKTRSMLGAPDKLPVQVDQSNVVLLTRAGSYNGGRHMINFKEVKYFLQSRYSTRLIIFEGDYTLEKSIQIFGKSSILIGVHGGAMYNLNFASSDAHVVEFLPMVDFGIPIERIAHSIIWHMSQLLGQTYWRIHQTSDTFDGDINVPIDKLRTALNIIDIKLNSLSRL